MKTYTMYIFWRDNGWYAVELKNDTEAIKNAECNPGTIRITTIDGREVWSAN